MDSKELLSQLAETFHEVLNGTRWSVALPAERKRSQELAAAWLSRLGERGRVTGVREFSCDYVGLMPLAKKYGDFPMYHVKRQ